MAEKLETFDVIIVGGSYAGLSAALALGRSLRKVLIIDEGKPCNAQTPHSHNFLTQDGRTPSEISLLAKEQVLGYPTVAFHHDTVAGATKRDDIFSVHTQKEKYFSARKLLLATGVKDLFPDIPGVKECWGISVLHCPFCHGYEVRNKRLAVWANGEMAVEFFQLIRNWSKNLLLLTNGPSTLCGDHLQILKSLNVNWIEDPIAEIVHKEGKMEHVRFVNGDSLSLDALFTRLPFEHPSKLANELGCAFTETKHIEVNDFGQTNVGGVYAAGDCTTPMRSVSIAVASGTKAGIMISKELIGI